MTHKIDDSYLSVWVITMSHWKKKIYENLDFRHFWWFLRLLLHSAQSFISSSWYESLLWVISDRIHLRITYANPHIMPIIQSSSVRASLTPSWHLRVGAREQHMMTHQLWVILMTSCSSQEEEACQVPQYIDL